MTTRRTFLQLGAAVGAGGLIRWQLDPTSGLLFNTARAFASVQTQQTALSGAEIRRVGFVNSLRTFAGRRVGDASFEVGMFEFQQQVLPEDFYAEKPAPFKAGTYVWGYLVGDAAPSWPGTTVEALKGRTTTIKYVNALPFDPVLRKYLTIDQTIHWADPLNQMGSFDPFKGPIPTVVHLHGAEDSSSFDGAPEAWFTPDGRHGRGYSTLVATAPNAAVYQYPNNQQATTLWFHDHALGITRINVFSGLAAFYFIRDQYDTGRSDNPLRLPAGPQEIELMIQDRQFDTNGQLLFPDSPANPSLVDGPPGNPGLHPYWIPEFFGDVICVNGRSWPHLNVEPRRYRFRIVNASNARFFRMGLADSASGAQGPSLWQIGTDGGLLDRPVKLPGLVEPPATDPSPTTRLFLAPSERADIILDFTGLSGRRFTLTNDAQVPFPSGSPLDPSDPTRAVMEFRVTLPLSGSDTTYNPASGAPLRGGPNQEPIIVRLADPSAGRLAPGVQPSHTRQLVLFEFEGPNGQPVEDLINNTKWRGIRDRAGNPPDTPVPGSSQDTFGQGIWMTELPRVGSTEVWEWLNLTVDAHPIHIHLIQFQLINRQAVAVDPNTGEPTYTAAWASQFPGGKFFGYKVNPNGNVRWGLVNYPPGTIIPGYGPPHDYLTPNADGALGGNPAFSPFLSGPVLPPLPGEAGWKDTIKVFPGFVNRFVVRWAPQAVAVNGVQPGQNLYSFDPTKGPGYVLHCHILDHEDNEMMRPYLPVP
ncbi:MAG: bilirubin oxidase [Bacillati bacterium ANGP1]|uniref:Bilirubin oxidase n=1 Tax=Candidatus Segetimicrobium genomatis TaxID=2569760 RepID=A0A537K131_9BACT|nr:MAG: bilirubin oxidase [Terrabacteria group bacterium ANGP1]